jgi:hypothetical protein
VNFEPCPTLPISVPITYPEEEKKPLRKGVVFESEVAAVSGKQERFLAEFT